MRVIYSLCKTKKSGASVLTPSEAKGSMREVDREVYCVIGRVHSVHSFFVCQIF